MKNFTNPLPLNVRLPEMLRPFFWDCPFVNLSWEEHTDFIIRRILTSGDWNAVRYLRELLGDSALARWLIDHQGAGLIPPKIRFWELLLGIPHRTANNWLSNSRNHIWNKRAVG